METLLVLGGAPDAALSVASRNLAWSEDLRAIIRRTVSDKRLLIRALDHWEQEDELCLRRPIQRRSDHAVDHPEAEMHPIPVSELFYDDAGPHVVGGPGEHGETVAIESLLLRGDAALEAALSLRPLVQRALTSHEDHSSVAELIGEVFDLVELARRDAPQEV